VPLLTRFQMPPVPISVVHHEGRQSTPKIRAFIDLAIATLRADATLH
jgi:DNA-binding transcriptional LysR family regulator